MNIRHPPIIPIIEENPKMAFVQTPQYYVNRDSSKVSKTAFSQQSTFYTNVSEGKSVSNAMFACGTNIVLRVSALRDVGGFDEESVTEDFATSFKLHVRGYSSYYYNNVFVEGMYPYRDIICNRCDGRMALSECSKRY